MNDFEKLVKVTSEVLNIHPDPINSAYATLELNMGELLLIVSEYQKLIPPSDNK